MNSFAINDQKPCGKERRQGDAMQVGSGAESQVHRAISQAKIVIKTQFFHFSNVVFPEFSKSVLKMSVQ